MIRESVKNTEGLVIILDHQTGNLVKAGGHQDMLYSTTNTDDRHKRGQIKPQINGWSEEQCNRANSAQELEYIGIPMSASRAKSVARHMNKIA